MTTFDKNYKNFKQFCQSQHSAGRVIWDTQDKYLDLKYIIGREGKYEAFTGLFNEQGRAVCSSASGCDGKLVNWIFSMQSERKISQVICSNGHQMDMISQPLSLVTLTCKYRVIHQVWTLGWVDPAFCLGSRQLQHAAAAYQPEELPKLKSTQPMSRPDE